MITLKTKKYRPYADVTMVVDEDLEIHLGMLTREQLYALYHDFSYMRKQVDNILYEYQE